MNIQPRDLAEERMYNALKAILHAPAHRIDDFDDFAKEVAQCALEEWANLRLSDLNCHGALSFMAPPRVDSIKIKMRRRK